MNTSPLISDAQPSDTAVSPSPRGDGVVTAGLSHPREDESVVTQDESETAVSDRDYAADMRAVIDAETGSAPYVSRIVANHIVEKLAATDADLLDGWLRAHAETLIWQAINDRDRSTRSKARSTAGARRFAAASEAAESGDPVPLADFLNCPYVIEDGSRKRLADLVKADLLFVASGYDQRAADNAMNSAFLKALAKKVGKGRVADQFTDEQLAEMWRSVGGR